MKCKICKNITFCKKCDFAKYYDQRWREAQLAGWGVGRWAFLLFEFFYFSWIQGNNDDDDDDDDGNENDSFKKSLVG